MSHNTEWILVRCFIGTSRVKWKGQAALVRTAASADRPRRSGSFRYGREYGTEQGADRGKVRQEMTVLRQDWLESVAFTFVGPARRDWRIR